MVDARQLPLFDGEIERPSRHDRVAQVAWSYSRRSTLDQCARRYYYEYFGAHKQVAPTEPAKEVLRALKGVQTRYERSGQILHLVIATYFRKAREGAVWDEDRLVGWARDLFGLDRAYSAANPRGGTAPTTPYPPVLLHEYHDRHPDADRLCQESEDRLAQGLRSFVADERFRPFRAARARPGALIEHHFRLPRLPCRGEGVVDLAYRHGDGATIVDWKLGADGGSGDDSLQLAAYALWATDYYACAPEAVRICRAHVASGSVVDFRADGALLAAARARIIQDAERMAALQEYGRAAVADAFTPCARPAVCALCPFARVCPAGKDFSHA